MTHAEISNAVSDIHIRYIQEATTYFDTKIHPISLRRILSLAAILITALCLCAFSYVCFSTYAGDNLILTASYAGDGIVLATIQNQSDKDLTLEPSAKLLYYDSNKPVKTTGDLPVITDLTIPANSSQTIRVDMRLAYDIEELEKMTNNFTLLQIANNAFLLGQRWTTVLSFNSHARDYVPQYVTSGDTVRAEGVLPSLRTYFENFTPDIFARWADIPDYLELVELELAQRGVHIVAPVDPLYYWDFEEYHTLVQSSCFDGYNKLLGRNDMEKIKHISISVPRLLDGVALNGTQEIPIFYLWAFSKSEVQSLDDYAFIRGNLLTFREMEEYKIFEDDTYVIYEMHHLVYSDLRNYVEEMLIQNSSIYFNEAIWERIQYFYNTYNDHERMRKCIKPLDQRINRIPMGIDDVITLSQNGEELSFTDLKPYSRFWEDIDYAKGYGLSFRIDSEYELFYALNPNGTLVGYFLYHNPSGDRIDIRYKDVEEFVSNHGAPQPRCECSNTETGDHGWHLTLEWLKNMEKDTIISYMSHVCSYPINNGDSNIYYYPLDDACYHVEVDWDIAAGEASHHDENVWLIHNESAERCNVRTENIAEFIEAHK